MKDETSERQDFRIPFGDDLAVEFRGRPSTMHDGEPTLEIFGRGRSILIDQDGPIGHDPPLAKLPPDAQPACRKCNLHPCRCRELEEGQH